MAARTHWRPISRRRRAYLATAPDDFTTRVVWAGEGVDLVNDILPAAEIIERIVAQAAWQSPGRGRSHSVRRNVRVLRGRATDRQGRCMPLTPTT